MSREPKCQELEQPLCGNVSSPPLGAERAGRGGGFQKLAIFRIYTQRLSGTTTHLTLPLLRNGPLPLPPQPRAERGLSPARVQMRSPCQAMGG
jgi:hypothetical protein